MRVRELGACWQHLRCLSGRVVAGQQGEGQRTVCHPFALRHARFIAGQEIVEAIGTGLLEELQAEVQPAECFSISADTSTAMGGTDMLSVDVYLWLVGQRRCKFGMLVRVCVRACACACMCYMPRTHTAHPQHGDERPAPRARGGGTQAGGRCV